MEPDADQDPEENGGTTRTDGEESTLGMRRRLSLQHEILLLCSSTWFLVFSAMLIPGIVLPLFRETFSMTLTRSGSLMTLFWLTHALVQYPSGFLSDRYGSRLIIGVGLATMACGQFLVATASSFSFLMVSFAMIGVGVGSYPSAGTTLLARTFDSKKGRAFGIHSAVSSLAGIVPLIIPLAIGVLGWRGLYAAYGLPALPLAFIFLRNHRRTFPSHLSRTAGGTPQLRKLLRQPSLRWLALLTILFVSAWQAILAFLPTFLVADRSLSLPHAGAVFSTIFLGGLVTRPLLGFLSDYLDRRRMLLLACIFGAVGAAMFIAVRSLPLLFVAALAFSVAGSFFLLKNGYLLELLRGRDAATGLGIFNTLVMLSASQSSILLGAIGDRYSLPHGLTLLAILMLGAAFLSLMLKAIPTERRQDGVSSENTSTDI